MYLDNAATSLRKPDCVAQAVAAAINGFGNPERGSHESSLAASRCIFDTRLRLSKLFNISDPSSIAFTKNATEALNIAINGLVGKGREVVTTAMEHNSVLRPLFRIVGVDNNVSIDFSDGIWTHINPINDVKLTIVNTDRDGVLDMNAFKRAVTHNTDVVIVSHASNVTGNINDVNLISRIAHNNNAILLVDAAQTAGCVNIDIKDLGIDVLCFTGHKSLHGPQGTGGIYVSPTINIEPFLVGGSGIQSYSKQHPTQMPTALEAGTLNSHGIAGLNAALKWLENKSVNEINNHQTELLFRFYEKASQIPNVKIYGDYSSKFRCPICSINVGNLDSGVVSDALSVNYGIATRPGAHCAPLMHQCLDTRQQGVVRFSFGYFNTFEEIEKATIALKQIA